MSADTDELRETNRRLNRRANAQDAYWQSRAMKAEYEAQMWENQWLHTFERMMGAHSELRRIYDIVREARSLPPGKYHSVMDCNVEGHRVWSHGSQAAADVVQRSEYHDERPVYANVFDPAGRKTREGQVASERVLDAVASLILPIKAPTP